jgi:hypothetical protein
MDKARAEDEPRLSFNQLQVNKSDYADILGDDSSEDEELNRFYA